MAATAELSSKLRVSILGYGANLQEEESSGLGILQIPPVFHPGSCSHPVKPRPPSPAALPAS